MTLCKGDVSPCAQPRPTMYIARALRRSGRLLGAARGRTTDGHKSLKDGEDTRPTCPGMSPLLAREPLPRGLAGPAKGAGAAAPFAFRTLARVEKPPRPARA